MDAVEKAQSGHPGTPMALAPAAYVLWTRHLKHDPASPSWADRDRFVLSCGHASMLLYSLLHLTGYDLSLDDIRDFRQWGSRTPGHPERGHTAGVETTTGPLGQGIGNAVGMAIAERLLAERFNRPGHPVVEHRTWALASDGDLMEGVASEAASLAGHLRLGKLTLIYDDNHITIDGDTALSFSEDVGRRFVAYGWQVQRIEDGNDLDAIDQALAAATADPRPSLVILRTIIADPAPTKRNTSEAHGAPLGPEEIAGTKAILGWPETPFHVPAEALADMRQCRDRGLVWHADWEARFGAYATAHPGLAAGFGDAMAGRLPPGWEACLPDFTDAKGLATRQASGQVLNLLVQAIPMLAGGSADLAGSTGLTVTHGGSFGPDHNGRSLHWGIREHGMAAALNGMAAHGGVRPYGSTFFVFADYMKPAIRLAALMGLPVIYVFTHDSIGVGEDGPTHQPVEQVSSLRLTPNMSLWRPCDAVETAVAWKAAIERKDGPTALILSRQNLPHQARNSDQLANIARGGYVLIDAGGTPEAVIIATGSEVALAVDAAKQLNERGRRVRVVSLPSTDVFDAQDAAYRESVLPSAVTARVAVEAGIADYWYKYVGLGGRIIGMRSFGESAPAGALVKQFGFTPENVVKAVEETLSA